jgi:protein AbiQ
MEYKDFKFVYIDQSYLKLLHKVDSEIFYSEETDYTKKPYLGILLTENSKEYVIPLTSAKEKHKRWRDVTSSNYRIYEIIDVRKNVVDDNDIIVDIENIDILKNKNILEKDFPFYKKRILSVLEIKKMFPVSEKYYTNVDLTVPAKMKQETDRRILMEKEFQFCKSIKKGILARATKIYKKQIETKVVLKFYCNYKLLEDTLENLL